MYIFLQDKLKTGCFLVVFFAYTVVTFSMENPPTLSHKNHFNITKTITVFDSEQALELGKSWRKIVPGALAITPDCKGFVTGRYGKVKYFPFDENKTDIAKDIIEHPCAKKAAPIIAMAKKRDGSLLVVSAGNYKNAEKKRVAEYIVFNKGWSKVEKLAMPIQAVSLDLDGTKLAIATHKSVLVVDCETNHIDEIVFKALHKWIVDVAVDKSGTSIIGLRNENEIQLMSLTQKDDDKIDVCTLKRVDKADGIKKIYYPTQAEVLYLTEKGEAKTIEMKQLFEIDDQEVKGADFSHSSKYNMIAADPNEYITTVHWSDSIKTEFNNKIIVYRKNSDCTEKFILTVPYIAKRYNYITEFGTRAEGSGHLLYVAVRCNRVIALATDGNMYIWELPKERFIYDQLEQERSHDRLQDMKSSSEREIRSSSSLNHKSRSNSREGKPKFTNRSSRNVFNIMDSETDAKDKKKTTFKKIMTHSWDNFSTNKSSREGSPRPKEFFEEVDLTKDVIVKSPRHKDKNIKDVKTI